MTIDKTDRDHSLDAAPRSARGHMKPLTLWLLLSISCSAPDLSLSSEAGCDTRPNVAGDDCGPVIMWQRTVCSIPLQQPWNNTGCHSPSGHALSEVWCCENRK